MARAVKVAAKAKGVRAKAKIAVININRSRTATMHRNPAHVRRAKARNPLLPLRSRKETALRHRRASAQPVRKPRCFQLRRVSVALKF